MRRASLVDPVDVMNDPVSSRCRWYLFTEVGLIIVGK